MLLLWVLACTGDTSKESATTAPPINQGDDTAGCSGSAPVIDAVHVVDDGTTTDDNGTWAAFAVNADVEDDDGDLTKLKMDLWWDTTVDGAVDTSTTPLSSAYHVPNSKDCDLFVTTFGLVLPVDNSRFLEKTAYEFAVVIHDAEDLSSEAVIGSGTTPAAL